MERNDIALNCEYLARAIRILNQKWSIEIILMLYTSGGIRFSALKDICVSEFRGAISSRTLADRLKLFRLRGMVERIPYNEVPPHVEYRLTETGEQFAGVLCEALRISMERMPHQKLGPAPNLSDIDNESIVDDEWYEVLEAHRKFMSRKLEKDPRLIKQMAEVIDRIMG